MGVAEDKPLTSDVSPGDRRLSFGQRAAEYDQFRPSYPREAMQWALGSAPLRVVDLGAGTGLMSGVLLECGHTVLAVEPDDGMRDQLTSRHLDRVTAVTGSAEAIPVADGSVDAIVAATSFHWFDLPAALPEMTRVLRPGGTLVIVWNVRNDDVDWVDSMSRIVGREDARSGNRDTGVPEIVPWFRDVERSDFNYEEPHDADSLVRLVDTYSYVALSPRRDAVLSEIRQLALSHPALVGRETFTLPYQTTVYRATRA